MTDDRPTFRCSYLDLNLRTYQCALANDDDDDDNAPKFNTRWRTSDRPMKKNTFDIRMAVIYRRIVYQSHPLVPDRPAEDELSNR